MSLRDFKAKTGFITGKWIILFWDICQMCLLIMPDAEIHFQRRAGKTAKAASSGSH